MSCPPISRSSTGTVADASEARRLGPGVACGVPSEFVPELGDAPTVGNRLVGSPGDTPVPVSGGRVLGAGSVTPVLGLVLADGETTMSVADAVSDFAPEAETFAETLTCSPAVAAVPTFTAAWISAA